MDLTHTFTVPTSVDDAWALFMDLERVGGCFPGATVTEVTDDGFSGTVKVKLGPIALVYSGSGKFLERKDAEHYAVIEAKGKDKRGNGTAGATVHVRLGVDDSGGRDTRVDVTTDLAVTGKPAQFGRGVMQDVSDKLLQAFVACIEKQLTGPAAAQPETESAPAGLGADVAGGAGADVAGATRSSTSSAGFVETGSDALAADTGSVSPAPVALTPVTTGAPAAPAAPPSRIPPRRVTSDVEEDAPLDLGSAVMPVLIQRYAGYAAAGVVGIVLGWLLGRGRGD
jgi:carbon monoxide dehydrogenase subunit G